MNNIKWPTFLLRLRQYSKSAYCRKNDLETFIHSEPLLTRLRLG